MAAFLMEPTNRVGEMCWKPLADHFEWISCFVTKFWTKKNIWLHEWGRHFEKSEQSVVFFSPLKTFDESPIFQRKLNLRSHDQLFSIFSFLFCFQAQGFRVIRSCEMLQKTFRFPFSLMPTEPVNSFAISWERRIKWYHFLFRKQTVMSSIGARSTFKRKCLKIKTTPKKRRQAIGRFFWKIKKGKQWKKQQKKKQTSKQESRKAWRESLN